MTQNKELMNKIGAFWSKTSASAAKTDLKLRWWQSPRIVRHINHRVSGEYLDGASTGLVSLLRSQFGSKLPLSSGVSVGGGNGQKELRLLESGIVQHITLYELSEERIFQGRELAEQKGLSQRIEFVLGDAFEIAIEPEKFDFVHWNNSLHHMMDVEQAVLWSKNVLKSGGLFYMDDFVGSSRFQWPDRQLDIASKVRQIFEASDFTTNPRNPLKSLPTQVGRPSADHIIEDDPSEAADSDNILTSVRKHFPEAIVKETGGVIYHLALNDMLHNFDEEEDQKYLDLLLLVDDLCSNLGETHYAIALAEK